MTVKCVSPYITMRKFLIIIFILLSIVLFMPISRVMAAASTLKCSPSSGTYNIGDTFVVDYILDTQNFESFGADVVATYDPGILTATANTSTPVTAVTSWGSPTLNNIDTSLGKIELQYGSSQPAFTGSTTIGKATFRAATAGTGTINFTFFQQFDDTTPGVAAVWGKKDGINLSNILTDVINCIYIVNASTSTITPSPTAISASPTATSTPTTTPTVTPRVGSLSVTELPRAGKVENSIFLLILAGIFMSIGVVIPTLISQNINN